MQLPESVLDAAASVVAHGGVAVVVAAVAHVPVHPVTARGSFVTD